MNTSKFVTFAKFWMQKYSIQLSTICEGNIFHTENSVLEHVLLQNIVQQNMYCPDKWATTMFLYPFYHDLGKIVTYSSEARNAKGHEELSTDFLFQDAEYLKKLFSKDFNIHALLFLIRNHNPFSFDDNQIKMISTMPPEIQWLHISTLHLDNESKLSTPQGYEKNRNRFKKYLEENYPNHIEDYFD